MHRHDPHLQADERTSLNEFLDYHRATFLSRIEGLDHEQLNRRLPPSDLTLASLAKHLAFVEDHWFQSDFMGAPMPAPWTDAPFDDDRDWELHSAIDDDPADLIAWYTAACERSRVVAAAAGSLDSLSHRINDREGMAFSLRWIMLHMIEETARHNGHADFIRESIDGLVGE
ncbi:DinB family protein [Ilumatobacter sp.]|uniref:DinB family protein n=1 Tax=Ilumatobacter sp. TaxID=1967498 RepID=UPI003C4F5A82